MNSADILKRLIEFLKENPNSFAMKLGLKSNTRVRHVLNGRNKLSSKFANLIVEKFPEINYSWLLTGQGDITNSQEPLQEPKNVEFSKSNILLAPFISYRDQEAFIKNFNHQNQFNNYPTEPWIADKSISSRYICFEIFGDAMESDNAESILQNDIVLSVEIKKENWQRLPIKKYDFVLLHKKKGLLCRRVKNQNIENGTLTIHSLNSFYNDDEILLNDVVGIFYINQIKRVRRRL